MLAEARDETGLPVITEVMAPEDVELVDILRRRPPDRGAQHAELHPPQDSGEVGEARDAQERNVCNR